MSYNSFGRLFRVTTWGREPGPAIGCVIDGCPPGIAITEAEIQAELDRRRPGQSRFTTQRREPDAVRILSGTFNDDRTGGQVTTGTPISLLIENVDSRSRDYSDIVTATDRAMPTTRTKRSTGCATIAAVAVRRRARRQCGLPPAPSPAR